MACLSGVFVDLSGSAASADAVVIPTKCIEFLAEFAFSVGKNVSDDATWRSDARLVCLRLGACR